MNNQSTTKGFAILSVAGMLVKILSLLYIPFLLRIIGEEGYGIYSAAYQIYVFIYVLTNSGIPVAISKLVSELIAVKNYKDAIKSFKIARFMLFILGLVMSLLMFVLAEPLARATNNTMSYLAIKSLSPTVFFTSIVSAYRGYFQGRGNMTPTAVSQIIEQIINTIFTLVFAALFYKYGLEAACAGGTIGTSLGAFAAAVYLVIVYGKNKKIRVPKGTLVESKARFTNKQLAKKIVLYGVPITLSIGLQNAGNIVDLANVKGRLLYSGFTESQSNRLFGIFTKYRTLLSVPITIISALSAAVLPAIAGAYALKDKKLVEDRINYAFRLCLLVSIPSAIGLAVLSKPIFLTIFGAKYVSGANLMLFGSIVIILSSVVQIQITILQSIGKLYSSTFYMLIGIIGKIAGNYILVGIKSINITGAVFGNIISFLIPLILNHRLIKKSLKIKLRFSSYFIKPLLSSILMGIVAYAAYFNLDILFSKLRQGYLASAMATVIAIIIGAYVYIYGLVLTGGISKEDLESLPRWIKKFIPKGIKRRIR